MDAVHKRAERQSRAQLGIGGRTRTDDRETALPPPPAEDAAAVGHRLGE